ncbi:TetR/AcrR family transcriptional regulator [Streptosporangium amethystogenes]|uniref:TetR/AcrR family transcriptional regulator n=1 Tax=Streptosporangium amethystogenes TaxID=2002 RepID=UPI0004CBC890|nr:TetR/AcrR family transcriptional regulator [Streptosporangium amethystogenes]
MNACGRRGLRRDAEINRERIMTAARVAFRERGLDVPLEEIARRAEVNIATLYRRFPDREALIEAILADHMAEFVEAAEAAELADDPWGAFAGLVERICGMQAADQGVTEALTTCFSGAALEAPRARAMAAVDRVIERARRAGTLRADFTGQDLMLIMMANAGVLGSTRCAAPQAWRRLIGLILDACRTDRLGPPLPPAPSTKDLHAAMSSARPQR